MQSGDIQGLQADRQAGVFMRENNRIVSRGNTTQLTAERERGARRASAADGHRDPLDRVVE